MSFSALDSALLGPLFATPEMRAAFSERAFVAAMLRAEVALARAQAGCALAPDALGIALAKIDADGFDMDALGQGTALAGVPAIPFVKAVQALLPPELEPHFHKGATTQDICDTALALQMRQAFALIEADIAAILDALAAMARAHRGTACVGRTYGQHAAPITFGYKAAIWRAGIAGVAAQLPALRAQVLAASLGGPVGTLAAMGGEAVRVRKAFAADLGLAAAPAARHALRGPMAAAGCWLALLCGALGKMATDVASLASTEIGEVAEPHVPGRGGSTAMPHKRNPVGATLILAAHAAAPGLAATMLTAMAAAHERPAGLWHAEWHALPQLFGLASGALREARTLARGLEVFPGRMRANLALTRGLLFADAAAALLAPSLGREAAHALVERAAARVRDGGGSLREVLAAEFGVADELMAPAFDMSRAVASAAGAALDAIKRDRKQQGARSAEGA